MDDQQSNKVGWLTMTFILMSDQIGYGILFLPNAYSKLGYIGGTLSILVLSGFTTYTGHLLVTLRKADPRITSYRTLFRLNFSDAIAGYAEACVTLLLFFIVTSSVLVQAQSWNAIFPTTCSLYWVGAACITSILVLQLRTAPNIGALSIINVAAVLVPNIIMIVSFFLYILNGSKKSGPVTPWGSDTVDAFVALLDLVFAFSGHVVFFELMQEMEEPEEFRKALFLSQGLTTFLYLLNGLTVYTIVGKVDWMTSPSTLSLDPGFAKDVCQAMTVLYFSLAMVVDGTMLVRKLRAVAGKLVSQCKCCGLGQRSFYDEEYYQDVMRIPVGGDVHSGCMLGTDILLEAEEENVDWTPSAIMSWLLSCSGILFVVAIVVLAIGNFDDLLGLAAALVASQTSISWPCFFSSWTQGSLQGKSEDCYYHGTGTSPCHCNKSKMWSIWNMLVVVFGIFLFGTGLWANSTDIARRYKEDAPKPFSCADIVPTTRWLFGDRLAPLHRIASHIAEHGIPKRRALFV